MCRAWGMLEKSDAKILIVLSQVDGFLNKRQLAKLTNLNENTVHAAIGRLDKNKLITRKQSLPRSANNLRINLNGMVVTKFLTEINIQEEKIENLLNEKSLLDMLGKYR